MRVVFKLTMPGVGSWNGQWTGAGKNYEVVRNLPAKQARELDGKSWHHDFGDGWCAKIAARIPAKGERLQQSAGFCGYDWMVDSIIATGHIEVRKGQR